MGTPRQRHPYEVLDGIHIKFVPQEKSIWLTGLAADPGDTLASRIGTAEKEVPMPADVWYRVRITDDGKRIKVYIARRGQPLGQPHLEVDIAEKFSGRRVAIYNREMMFDDPKRMRELGGEKKKHFESYIDNFELVELEE